MLHRFAMRAGGLLALILCGPPAAASEPPRPPDIIVLLCDDLGYGDLGCYGHPRIRTPRIDQIAREGMKFSDFYAGLSVCSPSRAALFTGRAPDRLGIADWIAPNSGVFLKSSEKALPRLLRQAGYRTGLFGKWHLNSKMDGSEPTPGDHGFDHWFATQNNAAPSHQNPINFLRNGRDVGPLTGNASTLVVDEAIEFVRTQPAGQPIALFVCFHAPHEPIAVPVEWSNRFADMEDETRRAYYASVELMDHEVGRLLGFLRDQERMKSSFTLFTSDNGPETLKRYKGAERSHGITGPLRGMKLSLYEGGIRVPAVIRWPDHGDRGTHITEPTCFMDVLPTLCAAAGISPPSDRPLDGVDLAPLFTGGTIARDRPLFWRYDKSKGDGWTLALREGKWKLLANAEQTKFALYNLNADISEKKDVSAKEPAKLRELTATLKKRAAESGK